MNGYVSFPAPYGRVIDGEARFGKTASLVDLAAHSELQVRGRYWSGVTKGGDGLIPVIYLTLGDTTDHYGEFDFLDAPDTDRDE